MHDKANRIFRVTFKLFSSNFLIRQKGFGLPEIPNEHEWASAWCTALPTWESIKDWLDKHSEQLAGPMRVDSFLVRWWLRLIDCVVCAPQLVSRASRCFWWWMKWKLKVGAALYTCYQVQSITIRLCITWYWWRRCFTAKYKNNSF